MCILRLSLLSLIFACLCAPAVGSPSSPADRDWTPEDSIAVRYYVPDPENNSLPGFLAAPAPEQTVASFSPGGGRFFLMSFHGDLATDSVVYRLDIYATGDVERALGGPAVGKPVEPIRSFTMSSASSTAPGISRPIWESDDTIAFSGTVGTGTRRAYRYTVTSNRLVPLSPPGIILGLGNGGLASWAGANNSQVFLAAEFEPWTPLNQYPIVTIRGNELSQLNDARRKIWSLYAGYRGSTPQPVTQMSLPFFGPWISPDGRWAVIVGNESKSTLNPAWRSYDLKSERPSQYLLVDLRLRRVETMMNAPAGAMLGFGRDSETPYSAHWSYDSRHVALSNTALHLGEDPDRRSSVYSVDFDTATHTFKVIDTVDTSFAARARNFKWLRPGVSFAAFDATPSSAASIFQYRSSGWTRLRDATAVNSPEPRRPTFQVKLLESPNDAQRVVASANGRDAILSENDPALAGVWRAPVSRVSWRESDGKTITGLLMMPRTRAGSSPVPLVIQGFSEESAAFRPDGVTFSAFAAQSLAARGFAVLQIDFAYDDMDSSYLTPAEGPKRVDRIDAAVSELAKRGLIDPSRVGLIGFSRSGWSTYYVLTHPGSVKLAAAIVFDSVTISYGEYVIMKGMGDNGASIYEKQFGRGNFWQNKAAWLEGAPGFNVDRISAPVLFAVTGTGGVTGANAYAALETIGALRYTKRPFEFILFPQSNHELHRPRERLAAMQASLDWMGFWLQERDPDKSHENRLERWRKIRTDWQSVRAAEQTPRPGS